MIPWALAFWLFFRTHLFTPQATYILAGDGVVVTKAGRETHGLDQFFSSIYGKPVPGLAFCALSLINVEERCSHPIMMEQIIRSEAEKAAAKAKKQADKTRKRQEKGTQHQSQSISLGDPKGARTRTKTR